MKIRNKKLVIIESCQEKIGNKKKERRKWRLSKVVGIKESQFVVCACRTYFLLKQFP